MKPITMNYASALQILGSKKYEKKKNEIRKKKCDDKKTDMQRSLLSFCRMYTKSRDLEETSCDRVHWPLASNIIIIMMMTMMRSIESLMSLLRREHGCMNAIFFFFFIPSFVFSALATLTQFSHS